jgi:hypothetical protein
MAKRVDHDSTMELSTSQLVPDAPPVKKRPSIGAQNDMSVWKQVVVGTDDFAPAAPVKTRSRVWLILLGLGVIAGAGGYWVYRFLG